jgi:uncharacterized protein (TIGR02246 family)
MRRKRQKGRDPRISDIRKVVESFVAAYNSGDAHRVCSFFTETAVLLPPNEPPVKGLDKIQSRLESFFEGFTYRIEFQPTQTEFIGGMGFERGTYSAWAVLKEGGDQPRGGNGEYMLLLEQPQHGIWFISGFGTAAPGEEMPAATDWFYQVSDHLRAQDSRAAGKPKVA